MANGIVLSQSVRTNLLSLQDTTSLQAMVQNRLATGKKVNSALDNPTNFFTAAGLNRRATDLGALLDGMSNGIKTIEAADNAIKGITKTVETMQANIRQARQDKSWKGESLTLDVPTIGTTAVKNLALSGGGIGATPVNVALNTIDSGGSRTTQSTSAAYAPPTAAAAATYTAQNTYATPGATQALTIAFDGGSVNVSLTTADTAIADAISTINTAIAADADATGKFEAYDNGGKLAIRGIGNVDGSIAVTGAGETAVFGTEVTTAGSNGQLNFTVNGTAVTLTTAESSVALAVTKANTDLGGAHAFEAFDDGGKLGFRAKAVGATALTIAGADAGSFAAAVPGTPNSSAGAVKTVDALVTEINANASLTGKVRASNDGGKLRIENLSVEVMTIGGIGTDGELDGTAGTKSVNGNDIRKNLMTQFNELRLQLDKLADDASYNGVNLLRGDKLKVVFNEQGTSRIDVEAKNKTGPAGISTAANSLSISTITAGEYASDDLLDVRLDQLKDSMITLQTHASTLGSNLGVVQVRQDFTKQMINTLATGADYLVNADMNEEGANLLSLNTRQQLSQTALSLASQADQAVLRLFG